MAKRKHRVHLARLTESGKHLSPALERDAEFSGSYGMYYYNGLVLARGRGGKPGGKLRRPSHG